MRLPDHFQRFIDHVSQRCEVVKKGREYVCKCPAHNDENPSLNFRLSEKGRIILTCRSAGCDTSNILAGFGLKFDALFNSEASEFKRLDLEERIVDTYPYRNSEGELLYEVVRYVVAGGKAGELKKDFRQRRPDGKGGWIWNLNGVERVPFQLPELAKAQAGQIIYIVEGEKDVKTLKRYGLLATTNAGGAEKWNTIPQTYLEVFRGKTVVILPDNDTRGNNHATQVNSALQGIAEFCVIVPLPGLPQKGDVSDFLAKHPIADLNRIVARHLPERFPEPIPANELQEIESDGAQWLWRGLIARGEVTLISALWKVGKTTLLSQLLLALQNGSDFCGQPVFKGARVLYVSEENQNRWVARAKELGIDSNRIHFLPRPLTRKPTYEIWLKFIEHIRKKQEQHKYDLIVIDTISAFWPLVSENDSSEIQAALMPLHELTPNSGILLVHHLVKAEHTPFSGARGGGAIQAFVDTLTEYVRHSPAVPTDPRRILRAIGRWEETPPESVIEYRDGKLLFVGSPEEARYNGAREVLLRILPKSAPGYDTSEIKERWFPKPCVNAATLGDTIARAFAAQEILRTGRGVRSDPWRYYINPNPERQQPLPFNRPEDDPDYFPET